MTLDYKRNKAGTLSAAYSRDVRVGYIESTASERWIWSLNTIQPRGGRASGVAASEVLAKDQLENNWLLWIEAAGLTQKEQP